MTGEIVNLRSVRKARERAGKDTQAAANRRKFGRTKAEKAIEDAQQQREVRVLDGARRERDED